MTMHFLPEQLAEFPESSDRRARVRRSPSALAYLEAGENNGGIVLNVSETGLAVSLAQSFAETHIPLLGFRLPRLERTFQTGGEIVWRSESKKTAGIRFVNLAEPDRVQIRNWIRAEIVEAELRTPQETDRARASAKAVVIMPSPRKVARRAAEFEAARDEARAAEFDRMFPSEASLNSRQPAAESELDSEIAEAAKAANEASALLAREEFGREISGPQETPDEVAAVAFASSGLQVVEPAAPQIPAGMDWRDEWHRFHLQRENLERARTYEMTVPMPIRSVLGEPVIEKPDAVQASLSAAREEWPNLVDATGTAAGRKQIFSGHPAAAKRTGTDEITARGKGEKSSLGIAALSCVLVAMCFVLGYAIQPGAFRFAAAKSADAEAPGPAPVANVPSAQRSAPTGAVPSPENNASDTVSTDSTSPAAQKDEVQVGVSKNLQMADNAPAAHELQTADAARSPIETGTRARPTIPSAQPAPTETPASAASDSPAAAVRAATVPVSFFPVTAPAGGSPPKLMQLPEETVSETAAVVIRAREFLFVPAQPGPESTHGLERVHIGDRVVKVDPTFGAGTPGSIQGGTVHLRATIGTDGAVSNVQPLSGPTALISVAVSAVRQWRYRPTDIDGKPIALGEDVTFEFSPSH